MKEHLYDCKTSAYSVYFQGPYDTEFREQYKGVIVNARGYGGYGHFAIRKPVRKFRKRLPKFLRKLFPSPCIMWKNDREKMYELHFQDADKSISIIADMKNPSWQKLTFAHCPVRDFYLLSTTPDAVRLEDALGKWPSFDLITLHVPAGAKEAYRRHPFYGKFKVVID